MELVYPIVLDGATGTQLQKRGYTGDICPEQWTLENPEAIIDVQQTYVSCGSNIVYTATFGGNRQKLEERGILNKTQEYNKRLGELSKKAVDGKAYVAGDIAPTGLFLAPLGNASFEDLVDIYTEQVAGLEQAGVDLYVIETMMTLSDARAAVLAIRSISDKPIFVTFSCDENGKTVSGSDIVATINVMQGMGINAFGLNCSQGPEQMLVQLRKLRDYARVPLIAKPNAGMPEIVDGKTVYNLSPDDFVKYVEQMSELGVVAFGGCCGSDETHIAALSKAVKGLKYYAPNPKYTDKLPASTEKVSYMIDPATTYSKVLACDADFEDNLSDCMYGDDEVVAVRIADWNDVDIFADCQYMINKPLFVVCDDVDLLEATLRVYQGRAVYDGNIDEKELEPLVKKYGLLI